MTMDATGHPRGGCSSGAPLLLVGGGGGGGGGSPPATPSYSPSLPTTAATPAQAPAHPPAHPPPVSATQVPAPQPRQTVKRSFDVAFLMAPDENLAKRQQLRLVAANALLKRPSPPPLQPPAPHSQTLPDTEAEGAGAVPRARAAAAAAAAAAAVKAHAAAGLFEPSGFFLPRAAYASCDGDVALLGGRQHPCYDDLLDGRAKQPHKVLGELHDSLQSNAIIRSAFTKVTASGGGTQGKAFDAGSLLGPPLATSPSSSLSGGGLSPDHVAYQGSMSPPGGSDGHTSSPVPAHFLPAHVGGGGGKVFSGGGGVPLLSPQAAHAAHAGPSPAKASLASAYSSAAFLQLQQEHGAKHIKPPAAHVLCGPGGTPPTTNGAPAGGAAFRADVDSYLIKSQAQHLYEKEMAFAGGGGGASGGAPKVRPTGMLYPHADSVAAYSTLAAAAAYPFAANFSPESLLSVARAPPPAGLLAATNPAAAAAMVSASLLPPSFAALSLPAQNVCAKCNISFRMTSDLVYHMRSQHKSDSQHTADPLRRRREQDKLKCPVCNESFRERHHLTRHMTAHQDKDGDADEQDEAGGDAAAARRRAAVAAAAAAGSAGAAAAAAAHVAK